MADNISTSVKNTYRIVDFCILKIFQTNEIKTFNYVDTEESFNNKQYLVDTDIEKTVWDSGQFKHRLNKVYNSDILLTPTKSLMDNSAECRLILKQGFNWTNIFGIHIVIKNLQSGETLISKVLTIDDFHVSENKELLEGSFWTDETVFYILRTKDILGASINIVTYEDIEETGTNIGLIYNYPTEYQPLVTEKPIPDYIQTKIKFDELSHFIKIQPYTTELKTLEKSILDYFDLEVANISIKHIIKYGIENNISTNYKTIGISNEDNTFGEVEVGLNLLPFYNPEDQETITIYVSTEISVNEKLMKRDSVLTTNLVDVMNPIIAEQIKNPETVFPVDVIKKNIINQNIIDTEKEIRVVPITQPVFVEMITSDIIYDNKTISFDNIISYAYLSIKPKSGDPQVISTHLTANNKYYFDLGELIPIEKEGTYQIIDVLTSKVIGEGKILPKEQ